MGENLLHHSFAEPQRGSLVAPSYTTASSATASATATTNSNSSSTSSATFDPAVAVVAAAGLSQSQSQHQLQRRSNSNNHSHNHELQPLEQLDHVNGDEEPYTIRCICDYTDDDGNTVLCEVCNTWQHISCYYHPKDRLDADDDHVCVVCKPRLHSLLDPAAANLRQQSHRGHTVSDDRKPRRAAPKSHRKSKTKDSIANGWPNGGALDQSDNSRDHFGPPAKRPKTSHRHSGSLSGGVRPRNQHNIKRMPPISELPTDYFSPDFMRVHRENGDCRLATGNLHLTIDVANLLSTWLDDPSAFEAATNGKRHTDILQRTDGTIEELQTVPVEKRVERDTDVLFHGEWPIWPYLTVERDVVSGELIGELKGGIGHQAEYKADAANRWAKLRHPDHFIFFHPSLPIYIDCRSEGTMLRYLRRSCRPNLQMSTIITGAREYHFCFTALQDIPAGAEITVNWDPDPETRWDKKDGDMTEAVRERFCARAETLLSHFGGCACGTDDCLMLHFDRRIPFVPLESGQDGGTAEQRSTKNGKKRRSAKRSPTDAGANVDASRASSEAVTHPDLDEDMEDARSLSHSAGSKPSRDNTPSGLNGISGQLSERERRKLLQQERLFEQMEHSQQQQGTRRKKRASGSNPSGANGDSNSSRSGQKRTQASGSNPHTPAHSSRPTPYFGVNTPARSPDATPPRPGSAMSPPPAPPARNYVDVGIQVDPPVEKPVAAPTPSPRKPCLSLSRRLLKKSLVFRLQQQADTRPSSPTDDKPNGTLDESAASRIPNSADVDQIMTDAEPAAPRPLPRPVQDSRRPSTTAESADKESCPDSKATLSTKPHAPPWNPANDAAGGRPVSGPVKKLRPSIDMRMELPPPPDIMAKLGTGDETAVESPDAIGPPSSVATSPQPPLSSSLAATQVPPPPAPQPLASLDGPPAPVAPVRKKMSLSAYMNKRKAEQAADLASSPLESKGPFGTAAAMTPAATTTMPASTAAVRDEPRVKHEASNGNI